MQAHRPRRNAILSQRVLLFGYIVVLVGILATVLPALLATVRLLDRQQHHLDPAVAGSTDMLVGALNQETALRGYVITAQSTFLAPFQDGTEQYAQGRSELIGARLGSAVDAQLDGTTTAFDAWRRFAEGTIAEVRRGDVAQARSRSIAADGKQLFDRFRVSDEHMAATVATMVASTRSRLRHQVRIALVLFFAAIGGGLILTIGLWGWWRVWGRRDAERERALADSSVLLQTVINATPEPIFAKDVDGRHILVNQARARSLAIPGEPAVLLGKTVDEFVDADLAARIRADELEVMAEGTELRLEEVLHQNDGPHVFLTTKSPLYTADGQIGGVVGVARDVTEERALQADRERLYQFEHELASTLQQAMLGNDELHDERLDIAARYQAAFEGMAVGGDWYDVIELGNGRVGLVVGDAVGHGLDAATAMGQLRSALTALAGSGSDPADTLEALDVFADGAVWARGHVRLRHHRPARRDDPLRVGRPHARTRRESRARAAISRFGQRPAAGRYHPSHRSPHGNPPVPAGFDTPAVHGRAHRAPTRDHRRRLPTPVRKRDRERAARTARSSATRSSRSCSATRSSAMTSQSSARTCGSPATVTDARDQNTRLRTGRSSASRADARLVDT